ncbi:hypothetical protein K437DRAFT_260366 [Tilletiaria anomala UBC 951]|uniref:3'-5' exonuclease domain-containing protein n=1 Tax=Tilletiaria anomala (strain ATCC 24038 / CBS 436.72 / UBC 951) TaxID=1037660 RepID=A0A066V213_TILAU|nr:uncharacterized protein K437DRAFT_260366 [Tilletiaria anomala UBC 951]KDN35486.1 hypothetical protein K437DRAFT_260366 [Tilletiaria anomala UBC 951]
MRHTRVPTYIEQIPLTISISLPPGESSASLLARLIIAKMTSYAWSAPLPRTVLVDTLQGIDTMMKILNSTSCISRLSTKGVDCSRKGVLSILIIWTVPPEEEDQGDCFIIDILRLGPSAFGNSDSTTGLRSWLGDGQRQKMVFDTRNLADALLWHFGVPLRGIQDLQLWQLATMHPSKRAYNPGLMLSITRCPALSQRSRLLFGQLASEFRAEYLGTPSTAAQYSTMTRPIDDHLTLFCIYDIFFFPDLFAFQQSRCGGLWQERIADATASRLGLIESHDYQPYAPERRISPFCEPQKPPQSPHSAFVTPPGLHRWSVTSPSTDSDASSFWSAPMSTASSETEVEEPSYTPPSKSAEYRA